MAQLVKSLSRRDTQGNLHLRETYTQINTFNVKKKKKCIYKLARGREMAPRLRALTALTEDPGSIPRGSQVSVLILTSKRTRHTRDTQPHAHAHV